MPKFCTNLSLFLDDYKPKTTIAGILSRHREYEGSPA